MQTRVPTGVLHWSKSEVEQVNADSADWQESVLEIRKVAEEGTSTASSEDPAPSGADEAGEHLKLLAWDQHNSEPASPSKLSQGRPSGALS